MMVILPVYICVTRPQWVNDIALSCYLHYVDKIVVHILILEELQDFWKYYHFELYNYRNVTKNQHNQWKFEEIFEVISVPADEMEPSGAWPSAGPVRVAYMWMGSRLEWLIVVTLSCRVAAFMIKASIVQINTLLSSLSPPGANPTNDMSIEFGIQPIFAVLWFKLWSTNHNEILHTSRQFNCCDISKISLLSIS